jgi:hypothetical protein
MAEQLHRWHPPTPNPRPESRTACAVEQIHRHHANHPPQAAGELWPAPLACSCHTASAARPTRLSRPFSPGKQWYGRGAPPNGQRRRGGGPPPSPLGSGGDPPDGQHVAECHPCARAHTPRGAAPRGEASPPAVLNFCACRRENQDRKKTGGGTGRWEAQP